MLASAERMNVKTALLASLVLGLVGFAAACGDGPDAPATPTVAGTPVGAASGTVSTAATSTPVVGPAPTLGRYVISIQPGHGEKVTQGATRTLNPNQPQGVCFTASFAEAPEQAQWFRMAVDGQEVTTKLTWIVSTGTAADKQGRACYALTAGLSVGRHTAAVSVQNPRSATEPTRQTVAWVFDVTP